MIAILMATYNGEKYLKEQIESLLNQTNKDWRLFIHDDGSTDLTKDIISDYCEKYDNICMLEDSQKHRGAAQSFMWLLKQVTADYYMFCDQDDVWLPDKIQQTYDEMLYEESQHFTKAIIIHTDLIIVDPYLRILSTSLWEYSHLADIISKPEYYVINNIVTGCTMMMNSKCKEIISFDSAPMLMHDHWILLHLLKYDGIVKSVGKSNIMYRQHGNNVFGANKYNGSIKYRICNLKNSIYYNYKIYNAVHYVLNISFWNYIYRKMKCSRIVSQCK